MPEDPPDEHDGRFWTIVGFQLPRTVLQHRRPNKQREEQRTVLEAFYAMLTDGRIGVGEGGTRPPRWGDPDYPAQLHFDIGCDDRPRKERLALDLGATRLPPQGGSCPVYADPAGHPFCLCAEGE